MVISAHTDRVNRLRCKVKPQDLCARSSQSTLKPSHESSHCKYDPSAPAGRLGYWQESIKISLKATRQILTTMLTRQTRASLITCAILCAKTVKKKYCLCILPREVELRYLYVLPWRACAVREWVFDSASIVQEPTSADKILPKNLCWFHLFSKCKIIIPKF